MDADTTCSITVDNPRDGDIRLIEFFAWLPRRIGPDWRWLCRVRVKQIYWEGLPFPYRACDESRWLDVCFED